MILRPSVKTTTRAVLLYVVVTDKSDKPVHGLKGHDFTVLEDGKAQQVRGFEERRPAAPLAAPRVAITPPPNTLQREIFSQDADVFVSAARDVHDHHVRRVHLRSALDAFGDSVS